MKMPFRCILKVYFKNLSYSKSPICPVCPYSGIYVQTVPVLGMLILTISPEPLDRFSKFKHFFKAFSKFFNMGYTGMFCSQFQILVWLPYFYICRCVRPQVTVGIRTTRPLTISYPTMSHLTNSPPHKLTPQNVFALPTRPPKTHPLTKSSPANSPPILCLHNKQVQIQCTDAWCRCLLCSSGWILDACHADQFSLCCTGSNNSIIASPREHDRWIFLSYRRSTSYSSLHLIMKDHQTHPIMIIQRRCLRN